MPFLCPSVVADRIPRLGSLLPEWSLQTGPLCRGIDGAKAGDGVPVPLDHGTDSYCIMG